MGSPSGASGRQYAPAHALLYVDDPDTGDDDIVLFLGPDSLANPLEVVGREHDDRSVTVFHAMAVRPAYLGLYKEVNGIR